MLRNADVRRGPQHHRRPRVLAPVALACAGLLAGCERGPTSEELDQWLEEAREADRAAMARHGDDDERASWTLTVVNPIGEGTELRWRELDRMANTTLDTDLPPEGDVLRHASFRVVTLAQLSSRTTTRCATCW